MSIQIANNALENCQTIDQVVELINDESATDANQEMVAAKYAWDAAVENGYTDNASIETHLELLAEAGAEFDSAEALALAIAEKKH